MPSAVQTIVPTPRSLLQLAREALERAQITPDDVGSLLAGYIFAFQLKDWYRAPGNPKLGDQLLWASCPFAQTLAEVATGTKHFTISDPRLTANPHVADMKVEPAQGGPVGSLPVGAAPIGGGIEARIWIRTRQDANSPEDDYWGVHPLNAAIRWWDTVLPP